MGYHVDKDRTSINPAMDKMKSCVLDLSVIALLSCCYPVFHSEIRLAGSQSVSVLHCINIFPHFPILFPIILSNNSNSLAV